MLKHVAETKAYYLQRKEDQRLMNWGTSQIARTNIGKESWSAKAIIATVEKQIKMNMIATQRQRWGGGGGGRRERDWKRKKKGVDDKEHCIRVCVCEMDELR